MNTLDIMDLYFVKYDSYQNLWIIYIIVLIGLLVYVSGRPQFMSSGLRKLTVLGCFCFFALVSLFAILKNKSDIENLKSASTVSLVADNQDMVNTYLLNDVDNSLGILDWLHNHWEIVVIHLALDLIVIFLVVLFFLDMKGDVMTV